MRVLRSVPHDVSLLLALDVGRASVLVALVLSGVVAQEATKNISSAVVPLFWAGIGLMSFFVGIRIPPTVSVRDPYDVASTIERAKSTGPRGGSGEMASIARSLYAPHPGMFKALRRSAVKRFAQCVANEKGRSAALSQAAMDREVGVLYESGASAEDVRRVIVQCHEYVVSSAGWLPEATEKSLLDYLELLRFDLEGTMDNVNPQANLSTIKAILYRIEMEGLCDLRTEVLATTAVVRGQDGGDEGISSVV